MPVITPTLQIQLLNAFQDKNLPVAAFIAGSLNSAKVSVKTIENGFQANTDKVVRYKNGKKLDD